MTPATIQNVISMQKKHNQKGRELRSDVVRAQTSEQFLHIQGCVLNDTGKMFFAGHNLESFFSFCCVALKHVNVFHF